MIAAVYSENSDYSDPDVQTDYDHYTSTTPTEYQFIRGSIGTSAETFPLDRFTTALFAVIKNEDATNYVSCTFRSAGNGSTDNIVRIGPGKFVVIPDLTVGTGKTISLTANTAACIVSGLIVGT